MRNRTLFTIILLFAMTQGVFAQIKKSEVIVGESHVNSFNALDVRQLSETASARRMLAAPMKAPGTLSSRWIDRIQNIPSYMRDFHATYGEKVSQVLNGGSNWLSSPDLGVTLGEGNTATAITTLEGVVYFTFPANATAEVIGEKAREAVTPICTAEWNEANVFMPFLAVSLTYDYAEAFWANSYFRWQDRWNYTYSYDVAKGTGSIEYENTIYFTLTDDGFDHRRNEFQDPAVLSAAVTEFNNKVKQIVDACPEGYRYTQLRYFNEWLTMHNNYNSDFGHTENVASIAWSPLSAFRESTGSIGPVCESYARALKVLCDKKSIPCMLVVGMAKASSGDTGESHMWNEVQMEDGNWYAVDVTWNDPVDELNRKVSGYENEFWLLLGKKDLVNVGFTFEQSHPNNLTWGDDDSKWEYSAASLIADNKYVFSEPEIITQAEIQLGATKTMLGYSFSETLDFSSVANGKAWIASGFVEGNKVMLTRVNIVPANTGFIVTAETPGSKIVAPVSSGKAFYANLLVPLLEKQTIYPTRTIDGVSYTYMGIGTISGTTQQGFVKIAAEQKYGPNRCLLQVPTEFLTSEARSLDELEIVFDETSSVNDAIRMNAAESDRQIYNLNGQRLDKPGKGINIINGRKVFVR